MKNRDKIEYYDGNNMLASAMSSMVPTVGSKISIRAETYTVTSVTYAIDHSDDNQLCGMRANVDVKQDA